ncbi:dimethyl sulfoxide reductase anchor subunit family protein [Eggerthella sinensis]|uniref:DMSO reductase n=1 Tax=Eggerthella sinensis TaxID=242230 RepID=A0A3N0J2H1_9ACTN|nr:DmsC/YnfH family molybdoenzyme membrane anchor subunit [Eggerthella sinensis]RDB68803.1 DMSO reductase [Eggerthella sinensis]RNM42920.1 DMSO reductase [Eggerthella sinensis]
MDIQWSLVLFTAIASCGTWVSAGVAVDEVRGCTKNTNFLASVVALVLAVAGGIASVTHLSHPDRIMAVLGHPTPGIFLEALLIGLFIVCVAVYLILLKRQAGAGPRKAVAVLAAVIGIVFSFASGYSYMMDARTTWNTITLPLGYMGFGAASGLALYLLLAAVKKESIEAIRLAGVETVIGGLLALVFGLAFGFISGAATGSAAAVFWVAVVCGGVAPLVCGWLGRSKPASAVTMAGIAFAGGIIGSIAFRAVMWMVGTAIANYFGIVL